MFGGDLLVQLNAQARFVRRHDVAVFPPNGLLEQLRVEPSERLDTFLDQEIGAACGNLNIGCRLDRPTVKVWSNLNVVGLRHARDLFRLQDATNSTEGGLENGGCLPVQQLGELVTTTGADALDLDVLAGALLAAVASASTEEKEAWRSKGAAFFQGRGRKGSRRAAGNAESGNETGTGEAQG